MPGRPRITVAGLPRRPLGSLNGSAEAAYQAELRAFCDRILEIQSALDFEVGARGWGYRLENDNVITKGQLDEAERLITRCRKDANLPLDICAEHSKRAVDGVQCLSNLSIDDEIERLIEEIDDAHNYYTPLSFWDYLNVYLEIAVEKSDLNSLFSHVAREFTSLYKTLAVAVI